MQRNSELTAAIAATRFTMGARPGDITAAGPDPVAWLKAQLMLPKLDPSLPDSLGILRQHRDLARAIKARKELSASNNMAMMSGSEPKDELATLRARFNRQRLGFVGDFFTASVNADNSLSWRLLDFFSNHFSVSGSGQTTKTIVPTLERDAIAPNLLGNFSDLLIAVSTHPAMLIYLDNVSSFGPRSKLANKKANRGLNENLAREILELHTLGVNGGYTQTDVEELAMAISGWSTVRAPRLDASSGSGFAFREGGHEPGTRKVLGNSYRPDGLGQGKAILNDLSVHPSTAAYVSEKLVRHFVADVPPKELVNAMVTAWLASDGNIKQVITTMIEHELAWHSEQQKLKTPRELLISAARASASTKIGSREVWQSLTELGQQPFSAGSPAGFSDQRDAWEGAGAFRNRIQWAARFAKLVSVNALTMAQESLGPLLSAKTQSVLKREVNQEQARTLFLMSPEFQTR